MPRTSWKINRITNIKINKLTSETSKVVGETEAKSWFSWRNNDFVSLVGPFLVEPLNEQSFFLETVQEAFLKIKFEKVQLMVTPRLVIKNWELPRVECLPPHYQLFLWRFWPLLCALLGFSNLRNHNNCSMVIIISTSIIEGIYQVNKSQLQLTGVIAH